MGNNVPSGIPLFHSESGVTLIGGAAPGAGDLATALAVAPALVAADGGASAALEAGFIPRVVYGDMDSLTEEDMAKLPADRLHVIAEQESTDFDKALRNIRAPFVVAVGVTGSRIDHELAVYNALVRRPEARCIVLGPEDVVMHVPGEITLDLPPGTRLSLFPMQVVSGRCRGLRWPIDDLTFHPSRRIGTSNEVVAPRVHLSFDGPGMLLILPRVHLGAAAAALRAEAV